MTAPATIALQAAITVRRKTFAVDVELAVPLGGTVALLGANGAGKSTVISALAGLLLPDAGRVVLGGRVLTDVQGGQQVPPEHRRIGLMGQDPLLFPHLSALENVAFGPRSQGAGRAAARDLAGQWLDRMGIGELAGRRPRQLSGGQQQRVALARALAADPELLLLDEPLGALDARTAPEIRQMLRRHLRASGTTAVLVTHEVLDAAVLADQVVVLDGGRVVDSGATSAVLTAPRSGFGAALAGLNLVPGTAAEDVAAGGVARVRGPGGISLAGVAETELISGDEVAVVFAPSAVSVFAGEVTGSPRNHWASTVVGLESVGAAVRVRLADPLEAAADLTPGAVADLRIEPGTRVFATVKATEVRVYRR